MKGEPPRDPGRTRRGVVVGLLTAAVVVAARGAGLLEGWPGFVVVVVGVLAIPTSRELSRRVLLNGSIALGWLPLLWWTPWPWPGPGRVTLLMGVLLGALVGWMMAGEPRRRVAVLVPRMRVVDAIPLVAAAVTSVVVLPWLTVSSGGGAFTMLLGGWDHSAHYDIVRMIREHGVVVGQAGAAPLGDSWSYANYPQGFHTVAAALLELLGGPRPLTAATEVMLYARSLGVLTVVGTTVVAAGLCALPFLRRRPWVAAPAVILAVGGFVLGPGGFMLSDGFPNFAFAVVLLACVPLLVLPLERVVNPVHLAALGGALVGVAHGWVLLLSLAAPAAAVVLLPLRHRRFAASRARWLASGLVVAATAAAVLSAVLMVVNQSMTEVLTIPGAITAPSLSSLVAPAALAIVATLVTAWRPSWAEARRRTDVRVVATAVVPILGLAGSGAIAGLQLRAGVPLGYYFWKYAIGMAVLSIVLVAVAAARLMPPRTHHGSPRVWAASVVLSLAVSQVFGVTAPAAAGAPWASPVLEARAALTTASARPTALAGYLWQAVEANPAPGGRHLLLVSGTVTAVHPAMAGQWYNAVSGRWTDQANEALKMLFEPTDTAAERAAVAVAVLTADPDAVVLVTPTDHPEVSPLVPEPLRSRVVTW